MDMIPCFLNFVAISVGQEPVKHVSVGYRSKHVIRKIGWKGYDDDLDGAGLLNATSLWSRQAVSGASAGAGST